MRAGLLAAARALFARQGVTASTVDDIARLAQVSRATAFNYFPSKQALLAALVHEMEARFLHIMDAQFDHPASAAQRLAALFSWTAAKVEETPELSRVLIGASETTFGAAPDSGRARHARIAPSRACSTPGGVRVMYGATCRRRCWPTSWVEVTRESCTPGAWDAATPCGGGWMRRRSPWAS